MFNIVLLEPEIPSNTGNIGRTCLVTGSRLHLIEPMGFIINDRNLKRAGMDYWKDVDVTVYDSWRDFVSKNMDNIEMPPAMLETAEPEHGIPLNKTAGPLKSDKDINILHSCGDGFTDSISGKNQSGKKARLWMATTKALSTYDQAEFQDGDYIMFGRESAGIPEEILLADPPRAIRIPMGPGQRSLNLSNSAAIVLYEALRQNSFPGMELQGQLHHHKW